MTDNVKKVKKISSAQDALDYHKSWTQTLEFGYHPKLQEIFGEDLTEIFGPKAHRKSVRELTTEEINSKLTAIKNYSNKDYYVRKGRLVIDQFGIISLVELQILKLKAFKQIIDPMTGNPVLYGLDLDDYDNAVAFASGIPCDVDAVYVNVEDIQRPIDLVRQASYYFGNYDSGSFTGAFGRVDTEVDGIIISDGQQGSTVATDHRLLTIGVNYGIREGVEEDARLLLVTNIYKNPMKAFEIYRNQVIVAKATALQKGGPDYIQQIDREAYYLDRIVTDPKSRLKFKFEGSVCNGGESDTVSQFLKLFKIYCDSDYAKRLPFQQAIRTVLIAWPDKKVTSEAVWGLTVLFKHMIKQYGTKSITDDLVHDIAMFLSRRFKNSNDVWVQAKNSRNQHFPKDIEANARYHGESVRGLVIASAIIETVKNFTTYLRTPEGGAERVRDLNLPEIKDEYGVLTIRLPIIKGDGKQYERPEVLVEKQLKTDKDIFDIESQDKKPISDIDQYLNNTMVNMSKETSNV